MSWSGARREMKTGSPIIECRRKRAFPLIATFGALLIFALGLHSAGTPKAFAYGIGTTSDDQVPVHQYITKEAARLWSDPDGEILRRVSESAITFRWSTGTGVVLEYWLYV